MYSQQKFKKNLNKYATNYDKYTNIQKDIAIDFSIKLKDYIPQNKRILELGAGTGYLTVELVKTFNPTVLVAIDISEKMLKYNRDKNFDLYNASCFPRFIVSDAEINSAIKSKFDIICASTVFQWFER